MMTQKRILQLVFVLLAMATAAFVVYKIMARIKAHDNLAFKYELRKKDTSQRGYILMAPYLTTSERSSQLIVMDLAGNIVYQKKIAGIVGDFRQWLVGGHTRYSYAVYDPAIFLQNYSNGSVAHVVVLDSALNEIKQVRLLPHEDIVVDKNQGLDHHDMIMLSDRHYIVMASYIKQVTNIPNSLSPASRVKVAVPIIQEINNGAVTWQWDASVHPEFYSASQKWNHYSDSTNVQDYMHINGIVIDPLDSNLVVSFHNTNQLIKIDRQSGAIRWRLGGRNSDFALSAEQVFSRQHNPSFINSGNTLLLLDNGDSTIRKVSRILEFTLDEVGRKVVQFKSYNIPAAFALNKGNVQLVGDDYFICGGSSNYILKVNRQTGIVNTELLYNQTSFRAYLVNDVTGVPGYIKHH
jgi:arylsulfate sulfotransferase